MAQSPKDHKVIIFDKEAREALLRGAAIMAKTVGKSYGPKGQNLVIEKTYGRPIVTRDGVTISKEVYSEIRDENMGMQLLNEAAEATVRNVGDGTSATVVLTYNLLNIAYQQIAAGLDPMELKKIILDDKDILVDRIYELSQPSKKGQLEQVATISSGDNDFGKLIAEAVEQVGHDGGIITQKSTISNVDKTNVDGYYITPGYSALSSGKIELSDAYVIVSAKRITTGSEIIKLVNKVLERYWHDKNLQPGTPPNEMFNILFYGEFEGDAYESIGLNVQQGKFLAAIVKSPLQGGSMASQYLEDLAIYTGGKLISQVDRLDDITPDYIGKAEKARVNGKEAIIFGGEAASEDVAAHIALLKDQIDKEESDAISEKFKERVSKLEGKISIFRIGGANETQREEREFRIDDAIQATKAAAKGGIVAGAGSTLVELSRCSIHKVWVEALRETYKKLLSNAALPAEVKLNQVLESSYPLGFNLKKDDKLVDVIKEGILDPTLVLENIIENSAATAADAISAGAVITFKTKEE